jgi:hypothetical protein
MNTLIKNPPAVFVALCVTAPVAAILLLYGSNHWAESVVLGCLFIGACLLLALLGYSLWNIRHHRVRAVVGSLVCAYCLWQLIEIISKW